MEILYNVLWQNQDEVRERMCQCSQYIVKEVRERKGTQYTNDVNILWILVTLHELLSSGSCWTHISVLVIVHCVQFCKWFKSDLFLCCAFKVFRVKGMNASDRWVLLHCVCDSFYVGTLKECWSIVLVFRTNFVLVVLHVAQAFAALWTFLFVTNFP